jgi:hypothetical protein
MYLIGQRAFRDGPTSTFPFNMFIIFFTQTVKMDTRNIAQRCLFKPLKGKNTFLVTLFQSKYLNSLLS